MNQLIEACNSNGNMLSVVEGNIRVEHAGSLPSDLRERIISNKTMVIEVLEQDREAIEQDLIVGISGSIYYWTVSRHSTAYIERLGKEWVAWRETYKPHVSRASSIKEIARGNTFSYVLLEFEKYKGYVTKMRGRR